MEKILKRYYPNDNEFTEIKIIFFGSRNNPRDLKYYLNLLCINKKIGINYPNYLTDYRFFSFGNSFVYSFRTILNEEEKISNAKLIFNKLIEYGIKSNSVPIIEFINYGEHTTRFTLEEYLKNNEIRLDELQFERLIKKEKILVR